MFRNYRQDNFRGSVLMGMHDADLDPTKVDNETVRNLVATMDDRTWNDDSTRPLNHAMEEN